MSSQQSLAGIEKNERREVKRERCCKDLQQSCIHTTVPEHLSHSLSSHQWEAKAKEAKDSQVSPPSTKVGPARVALAQMVCNGETSGIKKFATNAGSHTGPALQRRSGSIDGKHIKKTTSWTMAPMTAGVSGREAKDKVKKDKAKAKDKASLRKARADKQGAGPLSRGLTVG